MARCCFSSSGVPQDLHSFPTRRSSDLAWPTRPSATGGSSRCAADPTSGPSRGEDVLDRKEDRKSTRLNSSHVEISYAVFCLKKKNPYRGPPQATVCAQLALGGASVHAS